MVREPSAVGEVRRAALDAGRRIALDDEALGRLALVCTEACENLVRHGGGGEVLVGTRRLAVGWAVELLALDRGSGIADLEAAFRDGHSGADSAGYGLGALRRLSDQFDIHSVIDGGTAVLARVSSRQPTARPRRPALLEVGVLRVARRGERRCGDACGTLAEPVQHALCLIDGLGHGDDAADAAEQVLAAFERGTGTRAAERLRLMATAARGGRGAVASVVTGRATPVARQIALEHSGLGNILSAVHVPGCRPAPLLTTAGTLGRDTPRTRTGTTVLAERDLIIMHSDGLAAPDPFARRDGLARRDPTLVAAVLYRDGARREDDCAVLVARPAGTSGTSGPAGQPGPPWPARGQR